MSVVTQKTLRCDYPDCDEETEFACLTMYELRSEALREGWERWRGSLDFCPHHKEIGMSEKEDAEEWVIEHIAKKI